MTGSSSTESRVPSAAVIEAVRTLVAFDTTSRESNLALIEHVRDYLASFGVDSALTYDDAGRKANLFATLPAADGERSRGGVVLSGHTDVVPVDGQSWASDPWEAKLDGDRLVGRGVCDMKSFCAVVLDAVPLLASRRLAKPVHLAFSYDEEVGCIGVRRLLADLAARGIAPSGCIIGEPTGMRVTVAHKGRRTYSCRVRGREAHSALAPYGVNAVQIACEIVAHIAERARRLGREGPFDASYDVPHTTLHTGVIHGGTVVNIVPADCHFVWEIRNLPLDDPDAIVEDIRRWAEQRFLPEMHAVDPRCGIDFRALSGMPGMNSDPHSDIAGLAHACNDRPETGKVSFGTEGALFQAAGIPTVICGPGHIEQAHQPDEWVSLEQVARCEAFVRRLADTLTS